MSSPALAIKWLDVSTPGREPDATQTPFPPWPSGPAPVPPEPVPGPSLPTVPGTPSAGSAAAGRTSPRTGHSLTVPGTACTAICRSADRGLLTRPDRRRTAGAAWLNLLSGGLTH